MYAKLINGSLNAAPNTIQRNWETVINPGEDILLELGYLPVQYANPPTVDDSHYAAPRWVQTETAIVQEWDVVKDTRPLTTEKVTTLLIRQHINTLSVDDNTALRMKEFYPEWTANVAYPVGHKVQYNGRLYKAIQVHTSQVTWEPINAPSLWTEVCETHSGTLEDPIPYNGNMVLTNGLYYTQDYEIYKCTRDTGNPVYNALSELVGLYVEVV